MKKTLFIGSLLLAWGQLFAQSITPTDTKNYIYTKNCLDADCIKKAETVQYFDGLGRPKQIIGIKASPAQKDVVSHIEYDQYGRQSKSFLPVPQTGTQNGAIYENPIDNATNSDIYGAEKIYTEQIIENAPLERVKQSYNVGTAWADKPVTYNYNTNTSATEVKKYTVSTTWVEGRTNSQLSFPAVYYPVNSLMKTSVTDEDGNTATEYKNGKGQTVLTRSNDGTHDIDTYYIYNEYGQLAYVIPPLASVLATIDETKLNNLCYQYRYDDFGKLVEKRVPGKGWEYFVYDKTDQLVMSQDANLKAQGKWLLTKYDQYGRVVLTGITNNTAARPSLQTSLNAATYTFEIRSVSSFTVSGMPIYYTNRALPGSLAQVLTVNYYDTYPPLSSDVTIPTQILGQDVLTQDAQNASISTKTLPTASYVKNIEDDNWTKDYIWYDMKGRVIGSHSINYLGGYTKTESLLDFAGAVQKTDTYHVRKQGEVGVTVKERYVYDPQYRLIQHYHQVDSKPEELLTENTYNELSEIKNKKVGNNLQSIDYAYNIRGWLTDVNKDQMGVSDLGGKLFAYKVKYNQKQGIENPDQVLFPNKNVTARYNGNIAEVDWRSVETLGVNPSITPKRYGYAYDKLNRLTAGYYQNPNNPYSKESTESVDYDTNGNITDLYRTSVTEYGTNTATLIDKLKYDYSGNQTTFINDYSYNQTGYEGGGSEIHYDVNGNMTDMMDKGINSIQYNFLNLSNYLHLNRNGIEDITVTTKYSADGTKLRKENNTVVSGIAGSTVSKTVADYLDGFQYSKTDAPDTGGGSSDMFSARAMEPQAFSIEQNTVATLGAKTPDLQFLPTAEGFYDYINDQYIYQYFDHAGNVRVSFARNSAGALQLKDNNDYYPFGMNHLKTGNAYFGQGSYKNYKFGSKELQEYGAYDFGARIYMPDIARWFVADPMAEENHSFTPYRYGFNNPIMFTDPNGMLEQAVIDGMLSEEGTWYNTGVGFTNSSTMTSMDYDGHKINWNQESTDQILAKIGIVGGTAINIPMLVINAPKSYQGNMAMASLMMGFEIPQHLSKYMGMQQQITDFRPVLHNGSAYMMGGDMFGISDLIGIGLSNISLENKNAMLGLGALAIILTKGRAADDILKAELAVEKGMLNPKEIHFMQSSIKNNTGEFTVLGNAEALKSGALDPEILRINVWKDANGKIWTLDHRRLGAFKLSELNEVPVNWATAKEVKNQMWKMTTQNGGTSIKLKLGDGKSMIIK